MRELTMPYAALDRFESPAQDALAMTPSVDHGFVRSYVEVCEGNGADEGEHFWIELGGEG